MTGNGHAGGAGRRESTRRGKRRIELAGSAANQKAVLPSFLLLMLLLPVLCMTSASAVRTAWALEEGASDQGGSATGPGTGFYLSAGWSREFLELKFDERAVLPSRNIHWDDWGHGVSLAVGYGFSPAFRAETALTGSWREASPEGAAAGSGMIRFTGYIPLWTGRSWEPHLIGGLNGSVAAFRSRGEPDVVYIMAGGELGAGVRATLTRHWAAQFDFIHSIHNLEFEFIEDAPDDEETRNVGRRGRSESLRVGLVYDF